MYVKREPTRVITCEKCGRQKRTSHPHTRFCSRRCRQKYADFGSPISGMDANVGVRGAIGELAVSVDLMGRGYEVFRNVSQHGSCDLVAMKGGRLLRVEVKCAAMNTDTGKVYAPKTLDASKYDILALYTRSGVVYASGLENSTETAIEEREMTEAIGIKGTIKVWALATDGDDNGTAANIYTDKTKMYLDLADYMGDEDDRAKAKELAEAGDQEGLEEFVTEIQPSYLFTYNIDELEISNDAGPLYLALKELVRCIRGGDETAGVSMDDALIAADEALSGFTR